MKQSYAEGKDIYARIGSLVYNVPYEECKEFRPDGTVNPEGKQRRTEMKSVVLGLMYSRGVQGIAEQLNITVQRAKEITEAFYGAFPKIKECIDFSQNMARTQGYVQTIAGRKRRLPDMRLPEFEFKIQDASKLETFDALDFESDATELTIPREKIEYYWKKMSNAYGWAQKQRVKDEALAEGIEIIDNGGKIGDASRQCLNARVQGSSADLTKLAMIKVHNDAKLREWGFKLILTIHDELLGECPKENALKCGKRLSYIMVKTAEEALDGFPFKSDNETNDVWYGRSIPEEELIEAYGDIDESEIFSDII